MVEFVIFVVVLIVGGLIKLATSKQTNRGTPSPRVQRLIERVQAQQSGSQPTQFQGQYTAPVSGQGSSGQAPIIITYPDQSGRAPSSAQVASVLQQLLQAGRQPTGSSPGQYSGPAQGSATQYAPPGSGPPGYAPPGQFQPSQPSTWLPSYPPAPQTGRSVPSNRPPQNPAPSKGDIDSRVRELMASGREVAAVRLLCDEQDMGIIEAQAYARSLVAPPRPQTTPRSTGGSSNSESAYSDSDSRSEAVKEEETRYVGSAAFAESVFDTGADDNVWASGWVDKPEPEDRSDMDELWQTVRNTGRPQPS